MNADPWVKLDVSTGKQGTKTVGDKLNGGSEWWYNYQTNGGWSGKTDIQVLIGTSSSSYSTVNASWYADDGSNKKVHANIGNFEFDKSGIWYAVGKYKSGSTTAYTSGTSWTSNTSLSSSMSTSNSPYWEVTPPTVKSFTVSTTGSDILLGNGTSSDPYIIAYNGSLVLTLSGSKNKTDANSSLQYNTSGSWNTTNSRTISSITSTTKTSVTVKMRCYNSTASLSGTESTTTIYYKSEPSYTVTINNDGNGTTSPSGAQSNIGQSIGVAVSATASTNYEFVNWTITSGSGTFTGGGTTSTSASTRFYPTSAATIRANFRSTLVYSLTVSAGSGVNSVTGSNADVTLNTKYAITATPKTGYTFSSWTASPAANGTFDNANSASTNVTVKNGSVTVTANASEIMRTITINGGTAVSTTAGVVTTGSATAAAPAEGKKFTGWTLGSGVTLSGGALTDRTIKFTATQNSSVTANYADRASVKLYFAKPIVWGNSTFYVHTFKNGGGVSPNAAYPGVACATTETINCVTYYTYQYYTEGDGIGGAATGNAAWDRVIFGCNDDAKKTGDLTISNGHYYYWNSSTTGSASAVTDIWYIKGTMNDWGTTNPITLDCANNKGTVNITLTKGTTYEFKVYDVVNTKMWSNSTDCGTASGTDNTIKATMASAVTLYNDDENVMKIKANVTGDYTFEVSNTNTTSPKIKVTFPVSYAVNFSRTPTAAANAPTAYNNTTSAAISSGDQVLSGNSVTFTKKTANTGYTWYRWENGSGSNLGNGNTYTTTISAATTVVAKYTENQYNATVSAGAGGSVSPNGTVAIKQVNGTSITATPSTNYVFKDWTISGGGITPTTSTSATQIFKATTTGGAITANFADQWNVKGDQWGGWATYQAMPYAGTANTFSKTFTSLPAKTTYHFKVVKRAAPGGSDVWYGVNGGKTLTRTSNSVTGLEANGGGEEYITFTTDVAGDYTITYLYNAAVGSMKVTVTYPTAYTVTFGKGTGGNTISATATNPSGAISSGDYVASGATVTFSQTALAGYTFKGWYTTVDGNTSAGVNGSNQLTINGTKTVYAQYTPNTYTVSFDNNGGSGATPGNKTVTYGQAYGTLPVGPTPPGADQFVGWFTDKTGGTQVTSSTIVSTASDHKLWARFESTFTVTVQYKCGADVLRAPTTTHASETSVAAEITAPEILGYSFVNWTGDNATFADATSATTTVNVTSATTVVANYNAVPMVYFKNNLDWDDVYVTFDCAFNGEVPSLSGKPYYKMTRLGQSSDIFYCVIPSTYTENNYERWAWYIAFDNTGTGYNESKHTGTYAFNSGEFIGRKDFDPSATMFIPYDGDTKSLNGGTTYQTGCWLQYNTNYSAYRVRVNTYVQGSGGSEVQDIELRSDVAGATEFKAKVYLGNANHVYGVMLYKDHMKNTNDIWYTNVNNEANTITSATTSLPWSWQKCEEDWQRCRVKTESLGNYIFTVSFATGRPMVDIEYPVTIGDFRLVYKDLATWNITHDEDWQQISPVFKKKANRVDTASFFVSYGSSPTVELQKCTAINPSTGAETWTKQGDNINISSITKKGVYNFTVIQNNDASSATAAYLGAYSGKYYVRTDVSDGGWNDYKSTANAMTYTEYSMEHGGSSGPYSYYFMRHVDAGSNIKFLVANDYSLCLTDTMIDDTYAHEWIEREANVRFTWNHTNNEIHRAYISGSSYIYDRFLVLEGDDKLFDADGHPLTGTYQVAGLNEYEMNFTDDQNWVYETTVQAKPNERVKLTAKFNDKIQYFYGAEGERTEATTYQLIGGTGSTMYKMRVVYDFKTNRLLAAWLPNGDISDPTPINADVMIIRYHQDDAQQITFSGDGKLTDVKTVYGAMEFNKYRLNNQGEEYPHGNLGISQYERDLFFISFPFDVKLNDVFGFGTYGKHWIIEYYDGKTRAKNGYWKDSPTNWKFVTKAMKDSYTLKANEGYVLALDLDELKPESSVWNYGVENVYLYFPSTAAVEDIQATHKTVEIDTVGYQCTINRNTAQGDRRVKDSHWHLIGVPSYANADHSTSDSWAESKGDLEQTIYYPNIDPAAWTSAAPFVYDWDASSNKFGVLRATSYSFKPMHSYLVQYARDTLEWRQVNTTPAAIAARRAMFAKEPCDFRLELLQDENVIDQAFISMRDDEEVTAEFDFNYDLSKMLYGAFTSKSNIYTFAGNEEVAANCLPFKEETTVVPVGLTVDEEGEYIFSIPDGTSGVGVTLVDNERQIRTNLALTDYMTYLPAGDHNNRFVLEISPIEQIVTGVEMINGENGDASLNGENVTGVCKKLIDGLLYIVKDGKVFDARGARLQ